MNWCRLLIIQRLKKHTIKCLTVSAIEQLFLKNWSMQYLILSKEKEIKNIIKAAANILDHFLNTVKLTESNSSNDTEGKGLKILTPNQMLRRLPIFLAQLKAGNNPEKLKNKIRQLLYSLSRSKEFTKQIYKSLIDII